MTRKKAYMLSLSCLVFIALLSSVLVFMRTQTARAAFPRGYFAPYVDVSAYPPFPLADTAQKTGTKYYTLAFVLDGGNCQASWGGTTPLSQDTLKPQIDQLRGQGGDVIVSFGGVAGTELAQGCTSVSSLQAQYQAVINTYHVTHVDFDVEGAAIADPASIDRRDKAIAGLQQAAQNAGNPLFVSYTLPVLPSGLTNDGVNLLQNALANHVQLGLVNVMAMDYGAIAPPDQMGANAIEAAKSVYSELQSLYPSASSSQLWSMIGITPMIGMNDVSPEVFTLQDTQQVLSFARQNNIGELAFWSAGRDQACPGGGTYVSPSCSGIQQQPFDYMKSFNAFTGQVSGNPPTVPPVPTTAPQPTKTVAPVPTTPPSSGTPVATPVPTTPPVATPPPPVPGQVIKNPGFETGTTAGWNCASADRVISGQAHSGTYSLQLAPDNATTGQCGQTVAVQPNHTYTLQAYVKGNYAFIGVAGYGETWTNSTSYQPLSVTFTTGATTHSVNLTLHGWYGQGNVLVDDVSLR